MRLLVVALVVAVLYTEEPLVFVAVMCVKKSFVFVAVLVLVVVFVVVVVVVVVVDDVVVFTSIVADVFISVAIGNGNIVATISVVSL